MKRNRFQKHHKYNNNRRDENKRDYSRDVQINPAKYFRPTIKAVTPEQIKETELAIKNYKESLNLICPKCQKEIVEVSTAITDKATNTPIHFDCAIEELSKNETLSRGDAITYIGQGRFGIVNHPNPHDNKHFTIKKIIEWENKDERNPWRNELSDLYSQVK